MPPISGSEKALMQGRAGIARSGATRVAYFAPNLIVLIHGANATPFIDLTTYPLTVNQATNDEQDTATFRMVPGSGVTPAVGEEVIIALGTSSVREFAGQVLRITFVRKRTKGLGVLVWRDIDCIDYTRLLNRRLVNKSWINASASTIAADIIDTYTSGFTRVNLAAGLPTIAEFTVIDQPAGVALRELVVRLGAGAGYRVDPFRDIHFWGTGGESTVGAPTPPTELSNYNATLMEFQHRYDCSQIRTRVFVEGKSTSMVVEVPAGTNLDTDHGLPIPYDGVYFFNASVSADNYLRIGSRIFTYDNAVSVQGPPATTLSIGASVGDTSVTVASNAAFIAVDDYGWVHDGQGNFFRFHADSSPSTSLDEIPASGFGSITVAIPGGTPLYLAAKLMGVTEVGSSTTTVDIEHGASVTLRAMREDSSGQSFIASVEGGDGIHERIVSGDYTHAEAVSVANADISQFNGSLTEGVITATWTTRDMNARAGATQEADMQVPDVFDTGVIAPTLMIVRSRMMMLPRDKEPPLRYCEGATTKLPRFRDLI